MTQHFSCSVAAGMAGKVVWGTLCIGEIFIVHIFVNTLDGFCAW